MKKMPLSLAVLAAALLASPAARAAGSNSVKDPRPMWDTAEVKPSPNAGKSGAYSCVTPHNGYEYDVYVPASYSAENPAGIHIFFHGQGKPGGKLNFWTWKDKLLEPFNLIGINMRYMDGDNTVDTDGKVHAAEFAIAQTCADYKVILGRGTAASFSGGGLPHSLMHRNRGMAAGRTGTWPFNHMALYGSNYRKGVTGSLPMSWFVGLGGKEWNLANAGLGSSQTRRTQEVLLASLKGYPPDVYLLIDPEKGHSISEADVAGSAELFARSDVFYAPFIYEPDYPERELAPIVKAANAQALAQASKAVDRVAKGAKAGDDLAKKAAAIKAKIDERIDAALKILAGLAGSDPVLAEHYAGLMAGRLSGHPRAKEIRETVSAARRRAEYVNAVRANPVFIQSFASYFTGGPKLKPEAVPVLEQIEKMTPEKSLVGRMTREFLVMKPKE